MKENLNLNDAIYGEAIKIDSMEKRLPVALKRQDAASPHIYY